MNHYPGELEYFEPECVTEARAIIAQHENAKLKGSA